MIAPAIKLVDFAALAPGWPRPGIADTDHPYIYAREIGGLDYFCEGIATQPSVRIVTDRLPGHDIIIVDGYHGQRLAAGE